VSTFITENLCSVLRHDGAAGVLPTVDMLSDGGQMEGGESSKAAEIGPIERKDV
jgi:hypothetical protein